MEKNQKLIFNLVAFVAISLLCLSCTKEPSAELKIDIEELSFTAEGGQKTISFSTNRDWIATSSETWATVTPSGNSTASKIELTVKENSEYDARTATITIKADTQIRTVTIKQGQLDGMFIDEPLFKLSSPEEQELKAVVRTNIGFEVIPNVEWIKHIETKALNSSEIYLTVLTNNTFDERTGTVTVKQQEGGNLTRTIKIVQPGIECVYSSCFEVFNGPDDRWYRVEGLCTKVADTTQGSWYLNDGTVEGDGISIHGFHSPWSYDCDWSDFNIEVGDEVTVEGPKRTTNGIVELVDVTIISVLKEMIRCDSTVVDGVRTSMLPQEGGELQLFFTNRGDELAIEIPEEDKSWINLSSLNDKVASFIVQPNDGGRRSTFITLRATDYKGDYLAQVKIEQEGFILEVSIAEFNAKENGDAIYRISGIVTSFAKESDNYGSRLYIRDASGETYIYGTVDATGAAEKLSERGVKVGDIVEVIGKKSSYNSIPEMSKGTYQWHKSVTPVTAAEAAALADDDKNNPQNYIQLTGKVTNGTDQGHMFDLKDYGRFDLIDETGSIYVDGVTTGWKGIKGNGSFATLGVKEGDTITIIAYKTSYNGEAQVVGMYVPSN